MTRLRNHWRLSVLGGAALLLLLLPACGGGKSSTTPVAAQAPPPAPKPAKNTKEAKPTVRESSADPAGRFLADQTAKDNGKKVKLGDLAGALEGLSPMGVSSPDGTQILYKTMPDKPGTLPGRQGGTPTLRLIDVSTGADSVFEVGGAGAAWRADGLVAYAKGTKADFSQGVRYTTQIFTRQVHGGGGPATQWTTSTDERLTPVAWAGDHLLLYRIGEGESLEVVVADGPGKLRSLGTDTMIVAVSPDGTQVALTTAAGVPYALSIYDVAAGTEVARAVLTDGLGTGNSISFLTYNGSWQGDSIVTVAGFRGGEAPPTPAIITFKVSGTSASIDQVLLLDPAEFPTTPQEAAFDGDTNHVSVIAPNPADSDNDVLSCDRSAEECTKAAVNPEGSTRSAWRVHNPSRPGGEGQ